MGTKSPSQTEIMNNSSMNDPEELEPGASQESMLITTDSFEEFSQEINVSQTEKIPENVSNIVEIQKELPSTGMITSITTDPQTKTPTIGLKYQTVQTDDDPTISSESSTIGSEDIIIGNNSGQEILTTTKIITTKTNELSIKEDNNSFVSADGGEGSVAGGSTSVAENDSLGGEDMSGIATGGDYLHDKEWLNQIDHVFILSTAGKPIYSLHGNEDKLATIFGVMQALVSVVQSNQDTIMSIHANGIKIVFLNKSPLILVAASRRQQISVQQIQLQLTDVYNQILSTLTLDTMTQIFEKRKNYDLRRLLAGSERLIDHLLINRSNKNKQNKISNNPFIFLTHSVRILPLSTTIRESITNTIQSCFCSKSLSNLVFAILIANNKLIALVRKKKYFIHPADLRLIFNLIECSESFKTAESWTPICLPKFHSNGFLHGHVSYLAEDCQACLMLLSVEKNDFFLLSKAKEKITEKLRRTNCLKAINDAMLKTINLRTIGIPEIRHFLYKSKSNAQLLCSEISIPYNTASEFRRLEALYYDLHHRIHNTSRPLKLIFEAKEKEIMLAWITTGYELYATFEPTIDKHSVITLVNNLLSWIKKDEDSLFILNAPTF